MTAVDVVVVGGGEQMPRFEQSRLDLFAAHGFQGQGLTLNLHRKRNAPRENRRSLERIKSVLESEAVAA